MIAVAEEKGQKLNFTLKFTTPIRAKDGKAIPLKEIKKGNKVAVTYVTTQQGINKAISIKVVE
jgi:hypothetical protein